MGFKWFVPGLLDGTVGFGGEESAGASFLRRDGTVWTTDKDGIVLALLAAEILAATGRSPSMHYAELTARHGAPAYARVDAPASREEKARLGALAPSDVAATELAGEPITGTLTTAPGNGAAIGGLKVVTASAWFAARPSGTEDVYKIYAESFRGPDHLAEVQAEARQVVAAALSRLSGRAARSHAVHRDPTGPKRSAAYGAPRWIAPPRRSRRARTPLETLTRPPRRAACPRARSSSRRGRGSPRVASDRDPGASL